MKKILYLITIVFLFGCVTTKTSNNQKSTNKTNDLVSISNLMENKTNITSLPEQKRLNIIFFILQNTKELNIHKMRGETDNIVMVNEDGREAVYDGNGDLVTNAYNKGSYNFFNYRKEPVKKFIADTYPWLKLGNDPADPTSEAERFFHYTYDLNIGIQTYIFEGRKTELKQIDVTTLSDDEKNVYKLFNYIIFNDNYNIKFIDENMDKLEKDGSYYWDYFYQIHDLFGILQK